MADDTEPLLSQHSSVNDPDRNFFRQSSTSAETDVKPSKCNLILAILACTLGSPMQIGLNTGILNSPEDVIKDFYNETYMHREGKSMPSSLLTILWAITVAFFCIGGIIGGLSAAYFSNRFGRKNTLLLNNFVAFICAGLQAGSKYAKSYEMLIIGRVIGGINCGINSAVAPLYLAEISPVALRGFCGTCNQLSITMGVLLAEAIGLKNVLGTPDLWPILVAFPALPAIYSLLTLTWCPKSPRYLLVNLGDDRAAEDALRWLRGNEDLTLEMETMRKERVELRNSPKFSVRDLWNSPELRWPLIICIVLQMSQQFSGINAVIYYSTSIFQSADLSKANAQYATTGTGAVNVAMTFVAALIMDKAGRRTLHMIGLGGMCIFSVILVICLSLQSDASWLSYISIVAVIVYIIFFATGPGAIPWFMVAEMFAQGPRSAAVSVSVVVNWLCNFTVGIVYPLLEKAIKSYSFLPFSVMLLLFFIFTFLFVPETKGKTITEITMIFKEPSSASGLSSRVGTSASNMIYQEVVEAPSSDSMAFQVEQVDKDSQSVQGPEIEEKPVKFHL